MKLNRKPLTTLLGATLLTVSTITLAAECKNETWNKIMQRGEITVGVKSDTKPWGYLDTSGELIGMEVDMAKEIAETMGVKLKLVGVQSSNRMQFLEQGKIDLMIATMSDRDDRRKIVGVALPNYYSSGTNVMAPKALKFNDWSQLKGKPVCGKQGAFLHSAANVIVLTVNRVAPNSVVNGLRFNFMISSL